LRERRILEVSAEGLNVIGSWGTRLRRWHTVSRVVEHGDHAFFYLSRTEAVILPRRAFADDRELEELVDTARRYHEEARRFVRPENEG
jgi:hypothetical protein